MYRRVGAGDGCTAFGRLVGAVGDGAFDGDDYHVIDRSLNR